jgi:two-component system, NarL family, response regulator LiaR
MKSILIADKQDLSKAGLLYLLQSVKGIGEITEADTKKELLIQLSKESETVVVLDYTTFDFTGSEDLQIVSSRFKSVHWILFSDELSSDFLRQLLFSCSCFSVIFKECSKEEIITALSLAVKNERYICNRASNQLLGKQVTTLESQDKILTTTEKEILRLIALGKTTKEIAQERFSSIHTITTHRKNIFRKLEVNSVHDATKYALRAGILDAAEYYI